MIPNNITKEHILKAINYIDKNGVPGDRESTGYNLIFNGKSYPPKYIISIANKFANNTELNPSLFSGGAETNNFLISYGFNVVPQNSDEKMYPINQYSWKIISPLIYVREMDQSNFLHGGMSIPKEIRQYFGAEDIDKESSKNIKFIHNNLIYDANITMDKLARTRLFWHADFSEMIKDELPAWYDYFSLDTDTSEYLPQLRIEKIIEKENFYLIDFIDHQNIVLDIQEEIWGKQEQKTEGAVKYYYGKKYERNPVNRKKAIEIHGLKCSLCGFDFEKVYGKRGKGFIEIHHTKPLSTLEEEQIVDPATDLIPVCSNCHRMIHRRKDNILSIVDMKILLNSKE